MAGCQSSTSPKWETPLATRTIPVTRQAAGSVYDLHHLQKHAGEAQGVVLTRCSWITALMWRSDRREHLFVKRTAKRAHAAADCFLQRLTRQDRDRVCSKDKADRLHEPHYARRAGRLLNSAGDRHRTEVTARPARSALHLRGRRADREDSEDLRKARPGLNQARNTQKTARGFSPCAVSFTRCA